MRALVHASMCAIARIGIETCRECSGTVKMIAYIDDPEVNPVQLREYAKSLGTRTKTDPKDALIIARLGATQQPRQWQPEPLEVRQLKALLDSYEAVKQDIQRELNWLEKARITATSEQVVTSIETVTSSSTRRRRAWRR